MKAKFKYTIILCFLLPLLIAQTQRLNLYNANSQLFNNQLYSFGIHAQKQNAFCLIYKLDFKLKKIDSVNIDLGKIPVDAFLNMYSDTLHGFLNIYLQQKDKKQVTVFRFNKLFERLTTIENIDVARLNSISNFENELFYCKKDVYTIKIQTDTSGKQFYLNKFSLKSELKNFEYEFKWQFPFERKNINSAHIFYADSNSVLLYVNVISGPKFGQWILKINAKNGKLIRGTKLNDKGETATYQYGGYQIDSIKKTLSLIGQNFTQSQFDQNANKLAITNAPFVSVYLIEIDSAGEILLKQNFKLPVNEPKTTSKKIISNYIFRINTITKNKEGAFTFETDIYKNKDNTLCYLYANTAQYKLNYEEEMLSMEKATLGTNLMLEKYYFTNDKMDMNGKICVDSLSQFETMFYKKLNFPIKNQFKIVDDNAVWLLTKSDIKKNSINFTKLSPVNKIYQLNKIEDVLKSKNPLLINLSSSQFILATQEEDGNYQLKLVEW